MSEIDAKQLSMDYGRRVRELRKEKNLTQRQLSEITGLKREYISLIEHGRTDMQLSTISEKSLMLLTCRFRCNADRAETYRPLQFVAGGLE